MQRQRKKVRVCFDEMSKANPTRTNDTSKRDKSESSGERRKTKKDTEIEF